MITPLDISGFWSGGAAPYTFSVFSGTLPVGLTLNPTTGIISGSPTVVQAAAPVVFRATDAASQAVNSNAVNFTITAAGDPLYADTVLLMTAQAGVNVNSSPVAITLTATGTPIIDSTIPRNGFPTYRQDGTWRNNNAIAALLNAQLGANEFCWEAWMWLTQYDLGGLNEVHGFGGMSMTVGASPGQVQMFCANINGSNRGGSLGDIALGAWNHMMLQRDNTTLGGGLGIVRVALNGAQTATSGTFSTAAAYVAVTTDRLMGYHVSASAPRFACAGMRLTKNSRRYLSFPFTPDDTPFLAM